MIARLRSALLRALLRDLYGSSMLDPKRAAHEVTEAIREGIEAEQQRAKQAPERDV